MSTRGRFRFGPIGGFTLVEILVVIAITTMLSALAITYSKTSERQITLYVETQKLASLIFRAKSFTLGTFSDVNNPNRCGYGVEIDHSRKTYSLFAYEKTGGPPPDCTTVNNAPPSRRVAISTFTLDPRAAFQNGSPDSLNVILFIPPNPRTIISVDNGGSSFGAPAKIYLETIDGLAERTITVSPSGQVDF